MARGAFYLGRNQAETRLERQISSTLLILDHYRWPDTGAITLPERILRMHSKPVVGMKYRIHIRPKRSDQICLANYSEKR